MSLGHLGALSIESRLMFKSVLAEGRAHLASRGEMGAAAVGLLVGLGI